MVVEEPLQSLPDAKASNIFLANPSDIELEAIYRLSFAEWGDSLSLAQYLEESRFLTNVPLAKDDGMTTWILTSRNRLPNQRPLLASCETFRKRALFTNQRGQMYEGLIYGIASVFVNPLYRRRGYTTRLMHELSKMLPTLPFGSERPLGSILYSDIGKDFYAKRGWSSSLPVNHHIEFEPLLRPLHPKARLIQNEDLQQLCHDDEIISQESVAKMPSGRARLMIVPDVDHILWHHNKETFACERLFGRDPQAKGAIAGEHGSRIWVVWVRRYYNHPECSPEDNTLYILRLVIEDQDPSSGQLEAQAQNLRAVMQAARAEAANWNLQSVKLWHPTRLAQELLELSGLEYQQVQREEDAIASLRWFGEEKEDTIEWLACEKYAWV